MSKALQVVTVKSTWMNVKKRNLVIKFAIILMEVITVNVGKILCYWQMGNHVEKKVIYYTIIY